MATVYLSDDAGLPALTYSATAGLYRFTNFKLILKACLVNGYGGKAAAGWTLIDEGDLFIVLRNATGHYVSFVSLYAFTSNTAYYQSTRIYLHESYTGMSGNVPQGLGVVTGIAAGNSSPHWWGHFALWYSANTTKWMIVADSRTFVLVTVSGSTPTATAASGANFDTSYSPAPGSSTLYVGDDLGGNFIAAGGRIDAGYTTHQLFSDATLTTLYNPVTGLLVDTGGVAARLEGMAGPLTFSSAVKVGIPSLELGLVRWVCAGVVQPGLRGIRRDSVLDRLNTFAAKNSIEGTSLVHNYSNILTPAVLSDGYIYQPIMAYESGRRQALATNNPGFW